MKKIVLVLMLAIVFMMIGCEAKSIRKECRSDSYRMCLERYQDPSFNKAQFKACWKMEYIKCCESKGVNP